ncbi:MAG: hypothetical protein HY647_13735 [Acidobacteria bacterium]|nr:hypothetical protein [Acidobacteriota bacterium]
MIAALLFLGAALYNFFGPEPNFTEGVAGLAISAALAGIHLFARKQESLNTRFLSWLIENTSAIQSGGAVYDGVLVNSQTEITQYQAVMSFLIISVKSPSRFYFVGSEPTFATAATLTVISLIFGWWGIPWGPVYTFQAITSNLRGGVRRRIGEVLTSVQGAEAR